MDASTTAVRLPELSGTHVSIITALAYAMAFAFEAGNAGAFGMSLDMVELQLMPAIFKMLLASTAVWWFVYTVDPIIPHLRPRAEDSDWVSAYRYLTAIAGLAVLVWILARPSLAIIALVLGLVAAYIAIDFLLPLLFTRINGYQAKRRHYLATVARENPLRDSLAANPTATLVGISLVIGVFLSAIAGYGAGRRQQDFFVTNLEPETIILRIYGERAVAAEFVRSEKRIKPIYKFLRLDSVGLTLRLERVGPITFTTGESTKAE